MKQRFKNRGNSEPVLDQCCQRHYKGCLARMNLPLGIIFPFYLMTQCMHKFYLEAIKRFPRGPLLWVELCPQVYIVVKHNISTGYSLRALFRCGGGGWPRCPHIKREHDSLYGH